MKHSTFRKWFYGSFAVGMISLLLLMPVLVITQSIIPVYILLGITGASMVISVISLIIASYGKS